MYIETISVLQTVLEYTCIEDRNQVCNVLCVRALCIVNRDQICTVFCVRSHMCCSRQTTSSVLHSESESTCIVDRNQFCTYSVLECICIVNRDQICTVFCVGSHKCFRQKLVLYCTLSQSAHALKIETSSVLYSVLECMSILLRDLFCIVSCEANFFCSKICICSSYSLQVPCRNEVAQYQSAPVLWLEAISVQQKEAIYLVSKSTCIVLKASSVLK